jgi:hypothetical protein
MARQCLFCSNAASTKEHLWADWILRSLSPRTEPIRAVIGKSAPKEFHGDVRIKCVCAQCNHGWMSALEATVKPFVGAMIHDISLTLTTEQQKPIAIWVTKTAMVLEATMRKDAQFYTRNECEELRLHSVIPDRSLLWLGRISQSGVFASGTHIWLQDNVGKAACDGQVATFTVGHLAIQILTIRIPPQNRPQLVRTVCRDGPWDNSLLGIYPTNQTVTWPPRLAFDVRGPLFFAALRDRWKLGHRR